MLTIEYGDCLNAVVEAEKAGKVIVAHGCNAQGVMGAGFAKLVRDLWPYAYKSYREIYKEKGFHLGQVVLSSDDDTNVIVANCITQEYYGRDKNVCYIDYDAVACSAIAVAEYARCHHLPVHMPLIGGGLGGGDEKRLTAILQAAYYYVEATLWLME